MFNNGDHVPLPASGRTAEVIRFIGEGGQGTVFEVAIDGESEHMALKWYFAATGTDRQRSAIRDLVRRGAPNSRFLWPTEIVELDHIPAFGYLMPLRPAGHQTLAALLKGRIETRSAVRTTLCREIANSFLNIHSQGLCYRDISFGNIFFDPDTGRILVCDNDNVAIDDGSPSPVLGTRKFMAPEIVRGESEPSTFTDLWSLSVLLFYILVVGHPLLGRRELAFEAWDEQAEVDMFGRDPLFVFHPSDGRNRPHADHHGAMTANWQTLPVQVRQLFTQAFTEGVMNPHRRVGESVWQRAMSRLEDSIFVCRRCGAENFFDGEQPNARCWACADLLGSPIRLLFPNGRAVVIGDRARIWQHHTARFPNYDFETPVAEVTRHPTRPEVWGLRNIGEVAWSASAPGMDETIVEPGRAFGLIPGTVFRFEGITATLEV